MDYAPFSLCIHVTGTRAKIAAVPGVYVNAHARGLPVSKLVSGFPRHLFLQPSV